MALLKLFKLKKMNNVFDTCLPAACQDELRQFLGQNKV